MAAYLAASGFRWRVVRREGAAVLAIRWSSRITAAGHRVSSPGLVWRSAKGSLRRGERFCAPLAWLPALVRAPAGRQARSPRAAVEAPHRRLAHAGQLVDLFLRQGHPAGRPRLCQLRGTVEPAWMRVRQAGEARQP